MRIATLVTMIAAPLALAACEGEEEVEMPMAAEEMPMAEDMSMMGAGAQTGQVASAEGTVTAIDEEAGTITIDHEPVPEVNWPAMTMPFGADEALRQQVSVGDEVTFEFRMTDGNEITSIAKQ